MPATCYFMQSQGGESPRQLYDQIYKQFDPTQFGQFKTLNGLGVQDSFRGQLILHTASRTISTELSPLARNIQQSADFQAQNSGMAPAPRQFNKSFDILSLIANNKTELDYLSEGLSVGSDVGTPHFMAISRGLKQLNRHYARALNDTGRLRTDGFRATTKALSVQISRDLNGLSRSLILPKPVAAGTSLRDKLNIHHKSLEKSFKIHGGSGEVRSISTAVSKANRLASLSERAGTVSKVISIGSSVAAATSDFQNYGAQKGFHTTGREAAGLAGSLKGGAVGATIGTAAALLVFGTATGGLGLVALGVGALAGSLAGKEVGEGAYDGAYFLMNKGTEAAVDWWFR